MLLFGADHIKEKRKKNFDSSPLGRVLVLAMSVKWCSQAFYFCLFFPVCVYLSDRSVILSVSLSLSLSPYLNFKIP